MTAPLKFVDSTGFMASSLPNLVVNLTEGIHKIKCKYGNKKSEKCKINF